MATSKLKITLSSAKVADMVEQVLNGQASTHETKSEYKQGFVDGVAAAVRLLRALEASR